MYLQLINETIFNKICLHILKFLTSNTKIYILSQMEIAQSTLLFLFFVRIGMNEKTCLIFMLNKKQINRFVVNGFILVI